jgi:hypothetical protein
MKQTHTVSPLLIAPHFEGVARTLDIPSSTFVQHPEILFNHDWFWRPSKAAVWRGWSALPLLPPRRTERKKGAALEVMPVFRDAGDRSD